jgi:ribonuclease HII
MFSASDSIILGVDEAGRGPLAGPVAVGVVAAPEGFDFLAAFPGLNDSKQLSEKKREAIFDALEAMYPYMDTSALVQWRVEYSDAETIDQEGIVPAIRAALARAVRALMPEPGAGKVFLDGSLAAPAEYTQETIIRGDATVPAIMLASVAAKVSRDRLMRKLAAEYPAYSFEVHKGYGTKAHYAALAAHGPCALHRRTFLRTFEKG